MDANLMATPGAPNGSPRGQPGGKQSGQRAPSRLRPPTRILVACAVLIVATIAPVLLMLSVGVPGASGALAGTTIGQPSATPTVHATPSVTGTPSTAGNTTLTTPLPQLAGLNLVADAAQEAYVNSLISKMSLDEEIGQMVMISFNETQMDPALQYEIQQYHVGAVVLYAFNVQKKDQIKSLVSGLQAASPAIPLLVATDQEGGGVNRLESVEGPVASAATMASWTPRQIEQRGEQDAAAMASMGINLNLAPVVDVPPVPGGIGDLTGRTFGDTPQQVTTNAGAYLLGLQQSGQVLGTLKHFPGLGDVPTDPHQSLYHLTSSLGTLENTDWAPYKALFATGQVYAVMSTHVVDDAVDPTLPASLSEPVLTGILRDQLGFNGVIITDGLYMKSLWGLFPGDQGENFQQIFLHAVEAGNDLMCSLWSTSTTQLFVQTIHDAVVNGTISKAHIDASVRRILLLKLKLGLITMPSR